LLRLTMIERDSDRAVLAAHGDIATSDVALLSRELERLRWSACSLVLDLSQVRFVDAAGAELLRRWAGTGLTLRGGSLFVQTLLRSPDTE